MCVCQYFWYLGSFKNVKNRNVLTQISVSVVLNVLMDLTHLLSLKIRDTSLSSVLDVSLKYCLTIFFLNMFNFWQIFQILYKIHRPCA